MRIKNFKLGVILAAVVTLVSITLSILARVEVIKNYNFILLLLTALTFGFGLILLVFGIFYKGGWEELSGGILVAVALLLLFIKIKLDWVIALLLEILWLSAVTCILLLGKAKAMAIERADEKEDFEPYDEKLKREEKERKEKEEAEGTPKIKSFKD